MHLRKSKRILTYVFLLIIVSSLNNYKFKEFNLYKINEINVSGLNASENSNFMKELKILDLNNIFFLDEAGVNKLLYENSVIENYKIIRIYPSTLDFKIEKTDFLAQMKKNGKTFLIGSNGKLTEYNLIDHKLPYIFGKFEIEYFLKLKKILDNSKFSFDEIKNFYFFPTRRWDIELKNNIVLKLPKDNLNDAINYAAEFLNLEHSVKKKIIDLRVKNQIITK